MQKIGIMGGTFNPIHIGHLIAAQVCLESKKLDKIIFIPTGNPPHKSSKDLISADLRFEMVDLAIKDNINFINCNIEIKREGYTYTYDTINELKNLYEDSKFYFIIGFDTLQVIDTWRKVEDVFNEIDFLVVNRCNSINEINTEIALKEEKYDANIEIVSIPNIEISSSEIRERVLNHQSIKYFVPEAVETFICKKHLYR